MSTSCPGHVPEYDESVNETYCALCLERLPNKKNITHGDAPWGNSTGYYLNRAQLFARVAICLALASIICAAIAIWLVVS